MIPSTTFSRISVLFLLTSAITSTQASSLFLRQAPTCGGNQGLQQCGGSFPSDFCCPKDSTCMSLNSPDIQSVICCPAGADCAFIQPITCDVTQLNATLHPDNQMHLSDTTGVELPTCGTKCCPLGYSCKSGMCSKDETTPSPTSSASSTPSPTGPASSSQTSECPAPVAEKSSFDGKSFAAGFVPGIVIGALGAVGLIWLINKRHNSQNKKKYSGDFGHVARKISDPIYDPELAARVDFMRRPSHSTHRSPASNHSGIASNGMPSKPTVGTGLTPRIRSMWDRTPKLNFGFAHTTNNNGPGLPANPNPNRPAPVVRAGSSDRDPYKTPTFTPKPVPSQRRTSRSSRSHRRREPEMEQRQHTRPTPPERVESTETIDVLMPAPNLSFLAPPKAHGMRDNRATCDSNTTTFTKLMERAGFDDDTNRDVKNFSGPGRF